MDRGTKKTSLYKKIPAVKALKKRLAITTGDPGGQGFFITCSSLKSLGPQKNFQFVVWSDRHSPTLKVPGFKSLVFNRESSAFKSAFNKEHILQIKSPGGPGHWLQQAGLKALKGELAGLITGPVSKKALKKYRAKGATDLLKNLSQTPQAFMCFRGGFFNVLLLSDHCALKQVTLKKSAIKALIKEALKARQFLPKKQRAKPLGFLGLNPHAGEGGILGTEEEKILKPVLRGQKEVEGPLSPDGAFLKKNWNKYSFFIACYHDQGLIPFKMIHGQKAFVQTLGLPFLRLGVSHGTGKDLKKKEVSFDSLLLALKEAIRIA